MNGFSSNSAVSSSQHRQVHQSPTAALGKPSKSSPSSVAAAQGVFDFASRGAVPKRRSGIFVQPPNEPSPADISESSLRTVCCASDFVSHDSMNGVVMKATSAFLLNHSNNERLRQRHASIDQHPVRATSNNNSKRHEKADILRKHAAASQSSPVVHFTDSLLRKGAISDSENFDVSVLMQALIAHVFGSDSQRVSNSKIIVDEHLADEVSGLSEIGSYSQLNLEDLSELMTLTEGDQSQTLLTHLYQYIRQQAGTPHHQKVERRPSAEVTPTGQSNNKNCSASLGCSQVAQTLMATEHRDFSQVSGAAEAIPQSDRLRDENIQHTVANDGDTILTIGSTKRENDLIVESKVEFDLGSFTQLAESCGDGQRPSATHQRQARKLRNVGLTGSPPTSQSIPPSTTAGSNRFARLRTPELVQKKKNRYAQEDSDEASSFTAAIVEWDDQKRRLVNDRKSRSSRSAAGGSGSKCSKSRHRNKRNSQKRRHHRKRSSASGRRH